MTQTQAEIDAILDEYQEREAELAIERAERGDIEARRPDARREEIAYAELAVGDYMSAEDGVDARWVEVVEIKPRDGKLVITFRTPQPLGVGLHDRWVIDRAADERVVIDAAVRRFLCHDCGHGFAEEEPDLACPRCGAGRDRVEDTSGT